MEKIQPLPTNLRAGTRVMMFIDGENLAIRYKNRLGSDVPCNHVKHIADVAVWTTYANMGDHARCEIVRKHYYTSCFGDDDEVRDVQDLLKSVGIQQPCVFKKKKGHRSKRVDISLTTDMLAHAHRGNYDVAILVTGDEDFIPLVEAVKSEGRRVVLWAMEDGLSKKLDHAADHTFDIGTVLFNKQDHLVKYGFASTG